MTDSESKSSARPLGEVLRETAGLSDAQIEAGLAGQEEKGRHLGEVLVAEGVIDERELLRALGRQLGIPFEERVNVSGLEPELVARLPVPFLRQHKIAPARQEGDRLYVATSNPLDLAPLDALGTLLGLRVEPVLAQEKAIVSAIHALYERDVPSAQAMMEELDAANSDLVIEGSELTEELDLAHEAPIIKLVNRLIYRSVVEEASDIHWEPYEQEMRVRFRVDGILHDVLRLPKRSHPAVTSRIKVMARLDIAERRLPQDGRIKTTVGGKEIDIRVSVVPTVHGERIVLRLLDRGSPLLHLEDVGFSEAQLETFRGLIKRTNGILLVTGPTGSGKTTTLYSAIQKLRSTETSIMTIEDPVEYQLEGISQIQVAPRTGLTFAHGLRSILRQDPDVILVGEIRDRETADVAIHASLTGHLVFSTLHTNDAAGAVTRLVDMGIEPYLISSSVTAILAQRLARRVCPKCAEEVPADPEILREVGIGEAGRETLGGRTRRGKGCSHCFHSGYRGRIGILEMLVLNDEVRSLLMANADAAAIRAAAVRGGMTTMLQEGGWKVTSGITTPEEVLRILST